MVKEKHQRNHTADPLVGFFSLSWCRDIGVHQMCASNAQAVQPHLWFLDAENCVDGRPFLASFATYL